MEFSHVVVDDSAERRPGNDGQLEDELVVDEVQLLVIGIRGRTEDEILEITRKLLDELEVGSGVPPLAMCVIEVRDHLLRLSHRNYRMKD